MQFRALTALLIAQIMARFFVRAYLAQEQVESLHHYLDLLVELGCSASVVFLHDHHLVHHHLLLSFKLQHLIAHVVDFKVLGNNNFGNLARQVLKLAH